MKPSPTLLVIGATFCFALMAVFTRNAGAPILTVAAWRSVFVAVSFGLWALATVGPKAAIPKEPATLRLAVLYGLALALASSTFVGGYAFTTVANTIFLHNLAPAVALPLAWWAFGERPGAATITGALIAVVGVGLLSGVTLFHAAHFTNPDFLLGDFLAFLSAVGFGAVVVLTKATRRADTPIVPTLFVAWSVAAVLLVAIAAFGGSLALPTSAIPWVVGLAIVSTTVPFYLLNVGMQKLTASQASVLGMAEVVFATLVGVVLFGESMAPIGWFGGALVVLGVLYPFVTSDHAEPTREVDPLPSDVLPWRLGRLGIQLALVNAGAALAILWGSEAATVLAWLAMVHLLRLGLAPLAIALDHRFAQPIRLGTLVLALGLGLGLLFRGRSEMASAAWVYALAFAGWAGDRFLSAKERAPYRDDLETGALALGLVALAGLAAAIDHPAHGWLLAAGATVGVVEAMAVALGAARGEPVQAARPESARIHWPDDVVRRTVRPAVVVPVALGLFLMGGVAFVPAGHDGVVMRFGRPLPVTARPGLAVRLPPPFEALEIIHTDLVRRIDFLERRGSLLSGDQSMVAIQGAIHYVVADPILFFVHAEDHAAVLERLARAALIRTVGQAHIDDVLTDERARTAEVVRARVQQSVDATGLGITVSAIELTSVAVPAPVTEAFLDVISAAEERNTAINQAEAYAAELIPRTTGEGLALEEAAIGEATSIVAEADAKAHRVRALVDARDEAPGIVASLLRRKALEQQLRDKKIVLSRGSVPLWLEPAGSSHRSGEEEP